MTTIASVVSSSRDWVRRCASAVTASHIALSLLLTLVVIVIATSAYVVFRLRATHAMEAQILATQADVIDMQKQSESLNKMQMEGLMELSHTVYGDIQPRINEQPKIVRIPLLREMAIATRQIEELRLRVTQLERYRLAHEGRHRDDER